MIKKIKEKIFYKIKGKLPVALIGAGGWGSIYLKKLSISKLFDVKIVMDKDINLLRQINKKYKYNITTSLEDILKSEIENVFIILPNYLHFSFIEQLLRKNKNVYTEKPLTNTIEEAQYLKQIALKNKVILYTSHDLAYEGYIKSLKYHILQQKKIFDIEVERSLPTAFYIEKGNWRNDFDKCPYGPLMQLGIHFIDFFNFLGEFEVIYSRLDKYKMNNYDYSRGILNYNGIFLYFKYSYISNNILRILVNGDNYNILLENTKLFKILHNGKKIELNYKKKGGIEMCLNEYYNLIKKKNFNSNLDIAINNIKNIYRIANG